MSVLKRRDRIVVFRLTQDEYSRLEKACSTAGARNLSDYTRRELLDRPISRRASDRLSAFEKRLAELQAAVRQISRMLRQMTNSRS